MHPLEFLLYGFLGLVICKRVIDKLEDKDKQAEAEKERVGLEILKSPNAVRAIEKQLSGFLGKTGPCDRKKAENVVTKFYESEGFAPPKHFLWFDSPQQGAAAAALIEWMLSDPELNKEVDGDVSLPVVQLWEQRLQQIMVSSKSLSSTFTKVMDRPETLSHEVLTAWNLRRGMLDSVRWAARRAETIIGERIFELALARARQDPLQFFLETWEEIKERTRHDEAFQKQWQHTGQTFWLLETLEQRTILANIFHTALLTDRSWLGVLSLPMMTGHQQMSHLATLHENMIFKFIGGRIDLFVDAAENCGWWWPFPNICIMCEQPVEVSVSNQTFFLHNEETFAIRYADGFALHALDGVLVTEQIVKREFTTHDIDAQENIELRRMMLERYGIMKYVSETESTIIHRDEYGILRKKRVSPMLDYVFVELTNSTAEPDGTFRKYFLRVPPGVISAREGVAWTFGLTAANYEPTVQT